MCKESTQKSNPKRGNTIKVVDDYDLFDTNINGKTGIYVKRTSTNKVLVFVPHLDEWAELKDGQFEVLPGPIPKSNLEFISRVKSLVYSYFSEK